jgi:hypothetical protein
VKRWCTEKGKSFTSYSFDRHLIYRTEKPQKRASNTINNWANELIRNFSNKEVQIFSKYMKKDKTSLAIR